MAIIGLIMVFVIALLVNYVIGMFGGRVDLTENKVFTLSQGTRNILSRLDTPVSIRYYVTDDSKVMSPRERAEARRVEDLLNEYVRNAPVKEIETVNSSGEFEKKKVKMLSVKKLNPEPNTDAEDEAVIDGLQASVSPETSNEVYFGIAIQCVDALETIPFVPAREETLLEYDLSRAISNVHGGKAKKVVVMSGMKVGGGMGANFQAPPKPAWIFYEQLGKDYDVSTIPSNAATIPSDASALIVLHPFDITEEAQFAIDQYLLNGGNVIAFVDPNFFYSRALQSQGAAPGMPPQQPGPAPSSNLDKLFPAWGVKFDSTKVLADLDFGTEILRRGNFSPTFLTLNQKALGPTGSSDPMTKMLNQLNMLTPGGFEIDPPAGITSDVLIQSSAENQLVASFDADPTQKGGGDRIRKNFHPFGEPRAFVVRLSGKFKTAFPEGDPAAKKKADDKKAGDKKADDKKADAGKSGDKPSKDAAKAGEEKKDESLKEGIKPGRVLLFSDVDFIYDDTCVRRTTIPGLNIQIPQALNQNLTLLQNAVEQMSGDPDLIYVRSRNSVRRPFTKQNEWIREAQDKYKVELASYQEKKKKTEDKINKIIQATPQNIDQALLSPEVQSQLKQLKEDAVTFGKKERELEKEVTREYRRKLALFKFGNALFMPVLIVIFGIGLAIVRRARTAAR